MAQQHISRYATTRCYLLKQSLLQSTDHEITAIDNATRTRVQAHLPAMCVYEATSYCNN